MSVHVDVPIWLSGTNVVLRSHNGEHCLFNSFSWSPCRKNSSINSGVHFECSSHGLAGCDISAECNMIDKTLDLSLLSSTEYLQEQSKQNENTIALSKHLTLQEMPTSSSYFLLAQSDKTCLSP